MTYTNKKLRQLMQGELFDAYLRGVAEEMVNDIRLEIDTVSPGKTQQRSDPTRTVVASIPGEPPNTDLGNLIGSIDWKPAGHLLYHIHDGMPYGIELEIGTSQIKARPYIRPVFADWKKKIVKDFKEHNPIK